MKQPAAFTFHLALEACSLGALLSLLSCGGSPPPVASPSPRLPRAPARAADLPLVAVEQGPLVLPTHFDPAGELVANCDHDECANWDRQSVYRGSVDAARCATWAPAGWDASVRSASGASIAREGGQIVLRDRAGGLSGVLVAAPEAVGCGGVGAWSSDGASLALRCGTELVAFDLRTRNVVARTRLLPGTPSGKIHYVWGDSLVLATTAGDSDALMTWKLPAKPEWQQDSPGATIMTFVLDPIANAAWVATSTGGGEYQTELLVGPDGETSHSRSDVEKETRVLARNPAGDAFVLATEDATWNAQTQSLEVIRLRPQVGGWTPGGSWQSEGLSAAISRDGARVVVFATAGEATAGATEKIRGSATLAVESEKKASVLDTANVAPVSSLEPIASLALTEDEKTAVVTAKGVSYALPLEGGRHGRRLKDAELDALKLRDEGSPDFTTEDGATFTRTSDGAEMSTEGCWFPEGWGTPRLATIRVVAGDPITGTVLSEADVASRFCARDNFARFTRGEPMPDRPAALLRGSP